jgi:hypothetical protein
MVEFPTFMAFMCSSSYSQKRSSGSKTIILPVVLYGCETWSLSLREEHRLRVFENRVLRRIFGSKRDEVMGGWRKLHNEELRDLYYSPSLRISCQAETLSFPMKILAIELFCAEYSV